MAPCAPLSKNGPTLFSSVAFWYQDGIAKGQPEPPYGPARLPHGSARQMEVEDAIADVRAENGKAEVQKDVLAAPRQPRRQCGGHSHECAIRIPALEFLASSRPERPNQMFEAFSNGVRFLCRRDRETSTSSMSSHSSRCFFRSIHLAAPLIGHVLDSAHGFMPRLLVLPLCRPRPSSGCHGVAS